MQLNLDSWDEISYGCLTDIGPHNALPIVKKYKRVI